MKRHIDLSVVLALAIAAASVYAKMKWGVTLRGFSYGW